MSEKYTPTFKREQQILDAAIREHKPVKVFALFSGGNDSMVSTHFAMEHGGHEVLHINTGIGVEETREFVRDTCRRYGWPLREEYPPDKTYEQFVLEKGFPGPAGHRYAYSWLKERALRKVIRETKRKFSDRVVLVTGVRNQESARRMGHSLPIIRMGASVWTAPMFLFSKIDLHERRKIYSLPQSEVAKNLGLSGECLCGAFAAPNEFSKIAAHYPRAAKQILALEAKARFIGQPHCVWGQRPVNNSALRISAAPFMPMCVGCNESKLLENR